MAYYVLYYLFYHLYNSFHKGTLLLDRQKTSKDFLEGGIVHPRIGSLNLGSFCVLSKETCCIQMVSTTQHVPRYTAHYLVGFYLDDMILPLLLRAYIQAFFLLRRHRRLCH